MDPYRGHRALADGIAARIFQLLRYGGDHDFGLFTSHLEYFGNQFRAQAAPNARFLIDKGFHGEYLSDDFPLTPVLGNRTTFKILGDGRKIPDTGVDTRMNGFPGVRTVG